MKCIDFFSKKKLAVYLSTMPHRRRSYIEEKVKVVAVVWKTELLQFLAALAILHQDELKLRLIMHPILLLVLVQKS